MLLLFAAVDRVPSARFVAAIDALEVLALIVR